MNPVVHAVVGDWHSALYAALKAVTLFLTAAAVFRVTQRRTIAEFTPFDWVTAVAVGAIVGTNAFIRLTDQAGKQVFRSYFINNRGDGALGGPALMDTGRAQVTDFCPPTGLRK